MATEREKENKHSKKKMREMFQSHNLELLVTNRKLLEGVGGSRASLEASPDILPPGVR